MLSCSRKSFAAKAASRAVGKKTMTCSQLKKLGSCCLYNLPLKTPSNLGKFSSFTDMPMSPKKLRKVLCF